MFLRKGLFVKLLAAVVLSLGLFAAPYAGFAAALELVSASNDVTSADVMPQNVEPEFRIIPENVREFFEKCTTEEAEDVRDFAERHNIDVENERDPGTGNSALHYAAENPNPEVINLLALEYNVSPDVRNKDGKTAFDVAWVFKNIPALRKFIDKWPIRKISSVPYELLVSEGPRDLHPEIQESLLKMLAMNDNLSDVNDEGPKEVETVDILHLINSGRISVNLTLYNRSEAIEELRNRLRQVIDPVMKGTLNEALNMLQRNGTENFVLELTNSTKSNFAVNIPIGTHLSSANENVQTMAVLSAVNGVSVLAGATVFIPLTAACMNITKDLPVSDSFTVGNLNFNENVNPVLSQVLHLLEEADEPYPVRQAAVWLVTDNPSDDKILTRLYEVTISGIRVNRRQLINETHLARAKKIVTQAGFTPKPSAPGN